MKRWWVIVAAGLAVFMASVDLSITNVALPTLGHFFAVLPGALEWVVLAYSLPAVALLLPLGRWVDTVALRGRFCLPCAALPPPVRSAASRHPCRGWSSAVSFRAASGP